MQDTRYEKRLYDDMFDRAPVDIPWSNVDVDET